MSSRTDGNKNPKSAKVLKLGFNISVSGDPDTNFEIVLDDKEQKTADSSSRTEDIQRLDAVEYPTMDMPKQELDKTKTQEVSLGQSTGAIPKHRKSAKSTSSPEPPEMNESERTENSVPKDPNIIDQIKSTMEHFEKFSDHIKEIPRLRNHPVATSTPLADKYSSKSDFNLVYQDYRPRKFSHHYDFYSRKEYFKSSVRPLPSDLFLKPLPAEGYYKRGIYSRFLDLEPYRHFGSDSSLNKSSDYKNVGAKSYYNSEKYEECNLSMEPPSGILKKSDSESGDKQSTSSAESIKDIKIYQSGGILIMQNFKDNLDFAEKKEMSEFSAKLIENCNKLKMEVSGFQDDTPAIGNSSDENKNLGKMVQFDLSSFEGQKSKSGDSSSNAARDELSVRLESSESTSDCMKNKDSSPQGTSQSQDFPSLSTQENDSIVSNQPGMSPSYASSKKLEWDSGADVGYLNLDLTKENLSTIEKIVLKGLSSDGRSEKNVVFEKQPEQNQTNRSKFVLERMPSDLVIEDQANGASNPKNVSEGSKRERESGKLSQDGTEEKAISKGEIRAKFQPTKSSSNENSAKRISASKPDESQPRGKSAETTDKSVNVNTLFDDVDFQTPVSQRNSRELIRSVESPKKPRFKSKSPKVKTSKSKNRLLRGPKKITPPPTMPASFATGAPKKVYKKVEDSPALNEIEQSRELEEIVVDQRFKIKQNAEEAQAGREIETPCKEKVESGKEVKTKSRPISASSATSNNTVLPKIENLEEKTKTGRDNVNDQVAQTSDCDCESVGIQAFSSQKSSDFDFRSFRKNSQDAEEKTKENVNTSSKNIQVFGLNSSLPKQLEHPKGTEIIDKHHTKSTQFFGGPLNSLPNYHSNLVTKPGESCGRVPNVLKPKKNSEAEIIRLKEENEKNILANDALSEPKTESKKPSNNENKENLMTKKSTNSKRSQSGKKNSKGNGTASQDSEVKGSEGNAKKKSPSVECSDCPHTSDEVSSMILTSEILKVHGDSIDRNIIKEKYFQSQLVELEKRKMISRSTSMEMQLQLEHDAAGKEYTTTACQYSPQSRGTTSGGQYQEPEGDSSKGKTRRSSVEQYGSSQNVAEERFAPAKGMQLGGGDSLPSSTQTAHSWVPGVQNSRGNSSGVGRARSFEYLPGHIYESSGNLREELPSETEQNLITSTSESDTAKGSASDVGDGESEGRNTLILENSSESSQNSNRMKILDDNLSRLSSALLKFWEKDAQVQSITQSLFMNFWKRGGAGDWLPSVGAIMSKTEVGNGEGVQDAEEKRNTLLGILEQEAKEPKGRELSIACQTEGKSPSPNGEKFYEDRKAFEKRISEEKRSQIKWIENEIHHLNILRKLLEKQNGSVQRKKTPSHESSEASKSEYPEKILSDTHPGPVTPVYGCAIIVKDSTTQERYSPPIMGRGVDMTTQHQPRHQHSSTHHYPSLPGTQNDWRNVMLSVGIQVSLNDPNSEEDFRNTSTSLIPSFAEEAGHPSQNSVRCEPCQSDANTQFPSGRACGSAHSPCQTDFSSGKRNVCNKDNCFCLDLSEKTCSSLSHSNKNQMSLRKGLRCSNYEHLTDNENKTSNSTDPELRVMESGPCFQPERAVEQYERPDLSESYSKSKSIRSTACKCLNCPRRVSSALNKTGSVCRKSCQSNVYLNYDKTREDCHCSKVQIQKSSNCHIIKIHGPKCCSAERCKRRGFAKKTENQSCQTDPCSGIKAGDGKTYGSNVRQTSDNMKSDAQTMSCNCCADCVGSSRKQSPEPCAQTKFRREDETKLDCDKVMEERIAAEAEFRNSSGKTAGGRAKNVSTAPSCSCCGRAEKEKPKADDHPRHYFLRIEEREMDDSTESMEQKKSLEVITVTVPVRKAGKGKIYGTNIQQSNDNVKADSEPAGCNCCADCGTPRKQVPDYEARAPTKFSREEPRAMTPSKRTLETEDFFDEFIEPPRESSQNYYNECAPREFASFAGAPNYSPEPERREGCKCKNQYGGPSREFQNEYNSHKKNKNLSSKEFYGGGNERFYEGGRMDERNRGGVDHNSACRQRGREFSPEYYNYNKREFMTKSELLKEEEQKRKVQQPSLQECLSSNRPDFFSSAERRRHIISQRTQDRVKKHKDRMECLLSLMQQCNPKNSSGTKRIFTTEQMKEQTMKRYKKLPEVTGKIADQKKKDEYRTNRLMAEIFAKKLQIEALKGHTNLSNSVSVLYTI